MYDNVITYSIGGKLSFVKSTDYYSIDNNNVTTVLVRTLLRLLLQPHLLHTGYRQPYTEASVIHNPHYQPYLRIRVYTGSHTEASRLNKPTTHPRRRFLYTVPYYYYHPDTQTPQRRTLRAGSRCADELLPYPGCYIDIVTSLLRNNTSYQCMPRVLTTVVTTGQRGRRILSTISSRCTYTWTCKPRTDVASVGLYVT